MQRKQIPVGYDSLAIFLSDTKNQVDKLVGLTLDKDNEPASELINYYVPLQVVGLEKLKGNLDLYFTFNKADSTLKRFKASLVLDNYERNKIIAGIRQELLTKFPNINDISSEDISTGKEHVKQYEGYEVRIKLDTASYSPSFYYTIELTK